eukprot:139630-Chlamydomonas_euryale.AAC.1
MDILCIAACAPFSRPAGAGALRRHPAGPGPARGAQGVQQLADIPTAARQGRACGRLRHNHGDGGIGRAQGAARGEAGLRLCARRGTCHGRGRRRKGCRGGRRVGRRRRGCREQRAAHVPHHAPARLGAGHALHEGASRCGTRGGPCAAPPAHFESWGPDAGCLPACLGARVPGSGPNTGVAVWNNSARGPKSACLLASMAACLLASVAACLLAS